MEGTKIWIFLFKMNDLYLLIINSQSLYYYPTFYAELLYQVI